MNPRAKALAEADFEPPFGFSLKIINNSFSTCFFKRAIATYKLRHFINPKFLELVFFDGELFLVVRKLTDDEPLPSGFESKFVDNAFKKGHREETVFFILENELRRLGCGHLGNRLVARVPIVVQLPWYDDK